MAQYTNLQRHQQQQFLKSAAIKGIGANKTLDALSAVGLGIRRTDGLKQYAAYAAIPQKTELLKYVRKEYRPSQRLFTEQPGFMTRDYRYTIKYQTVNKITGVVEDRHTRVISDLPMTIGAVEGQAETVTGEAEYWLGEEVIEWSIAEAEHAAGEPWR